MVFTPIDHRNGMRKAVSIKHRLSTADKSVYMSQVPGAYLQFR